MYIVTICPKCPNYIPDSPKYQMVRSVAMLSSVDILQGAGEDVVIRPENTKRCSVSNEYCVNRDNNNNGRYKES